MQAVFIQRFSTFSIVMTPRNPYREKDFQLIDKHSTEYGSEYIFLSLLELKPKRLQIICKAVSVHVAKA